MLAKITDGGAVAWCLFCLLLITRIVAGALAALLNAAVAMAAGVAAA